MNNLVYLVVEHDLEKNINKNIGIFGTKEKAKDFIVDLNKSGDWFEYGITEFKVK